MPDEALKKKLRDLCEEVEAGKKEPDEVVDLFLKNREGFFENAEPYTADSLYNEIFPCLTCSCGSTVDSCDEDGPGKYSRFFISNEGQIFRKVFDK